MIRFNDMAEYCAEVKIDVPRIVRITLLMKQDLAFPQMCHYFVVAGHRNSDFELVELKQYVGQAVAHFDPNGTVAKANGSVNDLTLQIRDAAPHVSIRAGRFLEAECDGEK